MGDRDDQAARRHARRRPAAATLTSLPTTATPRAAARVLGVLLLAGACAVAVLLLPTGGAATPRAVAAPVAACAVLVGALLVRRQRVGRWGVHGAAALCLALLSAVVLGTPDVQVSAAYASGSTLLALVVVALCSWVETAPYLVALAGLLSGRQLLLPDPNWSELFVQVVVVLIACAFAGFMVRAAAAAEVDALTGLPNRRGAERRLDLAVALAADGAPDGGVHSAAVVDLDHFKAVNDTHGHAAGDELLRDVAHALRWAVSSHLGRGSDALVARWGGDEFVVAAAVEPERLATALDVARALLPRGASCSAGVALVVPGDTPSRVLSRADRALYEVKRSERGRTEVASAAVG